MAEFRDFRESSSSEGVGNVFPFLNRQPHGVALYFQVADHLRGKMESGTLNPGDHLPPETDLAEGYHVSRHTIREALRYLKSRGYIESRQGKGSVVRDRTRNLRINPVIGSINDLLQFAAETVLKPVSVAGEAATGEVAELLNVGEGAELLRISALRCDQNGEAFGFTNVYVPKGIAEGLSPETIHNVPIYAQIERNIGIEVVGVEQRITAVDADQTVAEHLEIEPGEPMLRLARLYYEEGGRPVEFAESFHPSSDYEYIIHLRKGS